MNDKQEAAVLRLLDCSNTLEIRNVDDNQIILRCEIVQHVFLYIDIQLFEEIDFICYPHVETIDANLIMKKWQLIRVYYSNEGWCFDYQLPKSVWFGGQVDVIIQNTIETLKEEITAILSLPSSTKITRQVISASNSIMIEKRSEINGKEKEQEC